MDASRKALEILAEIVDRSPGDLSRDQHLMADLGLDSPKALRLIMDLEEELEIEISDDEAARLETVGDVLDFVDERAA